MKDTFQVWLVLERWNNDNKIGEERTTLFIETTILKKAEKAYEYIENKTFEAVKKKFQSEE